jgi:hypothetical protein
MFEKNASEEWGELRLLKTYNKVTMLPSVVVEIQHLQVPKPPLSR